MEKKHDQIIKETTRTDRIKDPTIYNDVCH